MPASAQFAGAHVNHAVRIYAEMVALLWDAGHVPLALELAANAVLHASSAFTVSVSRSPIGVRIAVRHAAPLPASNGDSLPAVQGHGLAIVAKVADRWAAEPLPDGKIVWAELPRSPKDGSPPPQLASVRYSALGTTTTGQCAWCTT
jgi:hypothetical protein